MWEAQKEIQRIHKEVLEPEVERQSDVGTVNVGFTQDEFKALLSFLEFFAYD